MLLRKIGPAVLTLLFSASLFAAEPMSADEVKSLLTDNTMNGVNLEKNKKFTNFFKSDGTAIKRNAKGKMKTGKWHVNDNGEHCTNWGKGDRCGAIIKVRENIYQKMDGDKPRVEFNASRGNSENL